MKISISTSHLYGMGGGAKAVFALARGLRAHGVVAVYTKTPLPNSVLAEMPKDVLYANWYPGCNAGYDLHLNIDHFAYDPPLAARNVAYIFHPHGRNRPPAGYELLAVSRFTKDEIAREWGQESRVIYIPIEDDYHVGPKERLILHVSRFSAPTQYADKGHRQMIQAFRSMASSGWRLIMAGSVDPNQSGYLSSIMAAAQGSDVQFAINPSRHDLLDLYSRAAIYWHMTGATMAGIPGAQEHLGLSTVEAMASGCVPIVRGTGGQPEIVEDGLSGVLVEGAADLARKTGIVAGDMGLWSTIQQMAYRCGREWSMSGVTFPQRLRAALDGVDDTPPGMKLPTALHYGPEDVDIIIPVWNSTTVARCLDRIPRGPRVILVDNGSDVEVSHPRIDIYVKSDTNLGFAGGNMLGFQHSDRKLVLMLNDDCIPPDDPNGIWLMVMLVTMSERDVGVVGAKLLYPDRRIQHAGVVFDWNRGDVGYHRWHGSGDYPMTGQKTDVPAVTGACLLCKRELFDLRPDLYPHGNYEDAHLCLTAWSQGKRVVYQPAAVLTHIEANTKRGTQVDYVNHNRAAFIAQWRDRFLDSEEMAVVRRVNADVKRGVESGYAATGQGYDE